MQCGFVREIAAALTAALTVDGNALLVDALRPLCLDELYSLQLLGLQLSLWDAAL
jgi:hypothetical protein